MKLLIQSAMIFFGTLMAAAVVALGEPARNAGQSPGNESAAIQAVKQLLQTARPWVEKATPALARPLLGWHE
jgi:hypothetical protein